MDDNGILSRERLAGYDPDSTANGVVLLLGAGAAGANVAQTLALSGVGELRVVDFDVIEPSNLTRSPMFDRGMVGGVPLLKAAQLARRFVQLSYAREPRARWSGARFEDLGLGAFHGVDVVVSAIDSFEARARLADITRLLQRPLIECGFRSPTGQVSVFPNAVADEPCWRCLYPSIPTGRASCQLYAREVADEGRVPATQSVAAAVGAIAAEATILALHGSFPLGGRSWHFDVRTSRSRTVVAARDPHCPGTHRTLRHAVALNVCADQTVAHLLDALAEHVERPILHLPVPVLVEAPCERCGAGVVVATPAWSVRTPPRCRACVPGGEQSTSIVHAAEVRRGDRLDQYPCRAVGLGPLSPFVVEDGVSGAEHVFRLEGSVDDLFEAVAKGA